MPNCYQTGSVLSTPIATGSGDDIQAPPNYASGMVSKIGQKRRLHLYIQEWMENRGLSDEQLGLRMGVARATVWRWRSEQHRLNPEKIEALARALDLEPQDLWRPPHTQPGRPSLDEMIKDAPEDLQATAADIVRRLVSR